MWINPDTVTHTDRGRPGFIRQVMRSWARGKEGRGWWVGRGGWQNRGRRRERERPLQWRHCRAFLRLCRVFSSLRLALSVPLCLSVCLSVGRPSEDEWCCWRPLCRLVLLWVMWRFERAVDSCQDWDAIAIHAQLCWALCRCLPCVVNTCACAFSERTQRTPVRVL